MVLHQHEAAKFRTEMTFDPFWQWGQDRPAIGCDPAFALVTGRAYRDHEVLHQKGLVPLEARSGRDLGIDHFLLNADARHHLTPAGPPLVFTGFRWRGAFIHAARFNVGATLQTFQTGNLFAQFGDGLLQGGHLAQQFNQQSLKLWTAQRGKGGWRRHMRQRIHDAESAQEKNAGVPEVLPLLPITYSEPSAVCKMTDTIEAFSNTVTENTCINV